jgi:hypothetical protein
MKYLLTLIFILAMIILIIVGYHVQDKFYSIISYIISGIMLSFAFLAITDKK